MKMLLIFLYVICKIDSKVMSYKVDICTKLQCDDDGEEVCGIRKEGEGFRLKLFPSECQLLKYGCSAKDDSVYGVISMDYCIQAFKNHSNEQTSEMKDKITCIEYDCSFPTDAMKVCGMKKDGQGFRVRFFNNKCTLWKYNCDNQLDFSVTELHICKGMEVTKNIGVEDKSDKNENITLQNEDSVENLIILNNSTEDDDNFADNVHNIRYSPANEDVDSVADEMKNIVVVRSSLNDFKDINETIGNFFAGTHVFDLPVREIDTAAVINETTRRRLIKDAGPVRVFLPWVIIPKNISDDFDHRPTLSTCFHKCPRKCPDTYAPVCGSPGTVAREPSLMFQNHCYMDVAQCKMFWENKSPTSKSSSYVEYSFVFCLGDELNAMYRFLPLIRTLQRMGRLRKKGRFHYRLHNMKFFNNMLPKQPRFNGK